MTPQFVSVQPSTYRNRFICGNVTCEDQVGYLLKVQVQINNATIRMNFKNIILSERSQIYMTIYST